MGIFLIVKGANYIICIYEIAANATEVSICKKVRSHTRMGSLRAGRLRRGRGYRDGRLGNRKARQPQVTSSGQKKKKKIRKGKADASLTCG